MIKRLLKKLHIDALGLGALASIIPLVADLVWWHLDYSEGGLNGHLIYIGISFLFSTILSIIAFVWYHRSTNKAEHLEARINVLSEMVTKMYLKDAMKQLDYLKYLGSFKDGVNDDE